MRTASVILGIGLGILWLIGLGDPVSSGWLAWFDGFAAIAAFVLAANAGPETNVGNFGGTVGLSVALFAMWIAGLATNGQPYQNWWTFAFACGFAVIAFGGRARGKRRGVRPDNVRSVEEERIKRSA